MYPQAPGSPQKSWMAYMEKSSIRTMRAMQSASILDWPIKLIKEDDFQSLFLFFCSGAWTRKETPKFDFRDVKGSVYLIN